MLYRHHVPACGGVNMWELLTFVLRLGSVACILAFGAVCLAFALPGRSDSDVAEGSL